jgi:hypothetical protein
VNRTHFLYRIDTWTIDGEYVIEHLAGIEDCQLAMATYRAACKRWPGTVITLRQGARVIEDNRPVHPRGLVPIVKFWTAFVWPTDRRRFGYGRRLARDVS